MLHSKSEAVLITQDSYCILDETLPTIKLMISFLAMSTCAVKTKSTVGKKIAKSDQFPLVLGFLLSISLQIGIYDIEVLFIAVSLLSFPSHPKNNFFATVVSIRLDHFHAM